MHSHLARPTADTANHQQQVVHHGTANEHSSQDGDNPRHAARGIIIRMMLAQRTNGEAKIHASLLQFLLRQVFLLHLLNLGFQVVGAYTLSQAHIAKIAIITHPVLATVPHNICNAGHRHHHLHAVQTRIERHILIHTTNGDGPTAALVIVHFLTHQAERIGTPSQFLGQREGNHTPVHLTERFLGITCQHTEGEHIEETAIYEGKVGTNTLVVVSHNRHIPGYWCIASGRLNLRAVAFQARRYSTSRL